MARYRTSKGDTLGKLSKKYGVSKKKLRKLNPDTKFGKRKSKGGKGFKKFGKDTVLKLGKGVGQPFWKSEVLQDPTYAAFDRNFEYDRSKLHSDFVAFKDRQKADRARQMSDFHESQIRQGRAIDNNMEDRGVYRSGQRHMSLGRMSNEMDRQRTAFDSRQTDDKNEARRRKQEGIGDLKRRRAEERLSARDRLTMRDAETKYGMG